MGEKTDEIKRPRARRSPATRVGDKQFDAAVGADDMSGIDAPKPAARNVAADATESTAEIRAEIEETRAQMSGTIDEIQERLSPRRLMNDATETVREATVGKVRDVMDNASESAVSIVDRIKENPVPAAMIGLGAWWLFRGGQGRRSSYSSTPKYGNGGSYQPRGSQSSSRYGVADSAEDATNRVSALAERTQETVSEYAERTQNGFDRLLRENPLVLGAVAVAIGAAVGMSIPETQSERAVIGEVRDQIVDKAQTVAQGAIDKVQEVASKLPDGQPRA
jgi:hypothetical protein